MYKLIVRFITMSSRVDGSVHGRHARNWHRAWPSVPPVLRVTPHGCTHNQTWWKHIFNGQTKPSHPSSTNAQHITLHRKNTSQPGNSIKTATKQPKDAKLKQMKF